MTEATGSKSTEEKERRNVLADTILNMTPNEAAQWVEDNVDDLPSAKDLLKRMAKVIVFLAKRA